MIFTILKHDNIVKVTGPGYEKCYNIKRSPKTLYQFTPPLVTREFWFSMLLNDGRD